jgi:hypothetical protein
MGSEDSWIKTIPGSLYPHLWAAGSSLRWKLEALQFRTGLLKTGSIEGSQLAVVPADHAERGKAQ